MVIWVKFTHSSHLISLFPRMSMFTLVISCLTTSNLPWFMDLTFQVPMQYCSLQHQTVLLSPVPSTARYGYCFGSIPSFFLELFLHWSPIAYWAPTGLGSSSFSVLCFSFSYRSWGSQGKNTEVVPIPFSSGPYSVSVLSGKGQFYFQSQRKAMPKNIQTNALCTHLTR